MDTEEAQVETPREVNACIVEGIPEEVDAGAELALIGSVVCEPPRDLRGRSLRITDAEGAPVASADFTEFDGETSETTEFAVRAPARPGSHTWRAALVPAAEEQADDEEDYASTISFTVVPHSTSLLVWGVPSAIVAGERFRFNVGMKCSSECDLRGAEIGIFDQDGAQVAVARLSGDVWPGSSALHFAEVGLAAPAAEGLQRWEARTAAPEDGLPHAAGSTSFGVRLVPRPECEVTIEAYDAAEGTPIRGAKVVMHPYRAATDAAGIARLNVPRGEYRVFVTASKYEGVARAIEVAANLTTRAELMPEPPEDPARGYY